MRLFELVLQLTGWVGQCGRQRDAHSQRYHTLIPIPVTVLLTWQWELCSCEKVKAVAMGRLCRQAQGSLQTEEEGGSTDTLILVQWDPSWTSDLQFCLIINLFCFKSLSPWQSVQAATDECICPDREGPRESSRRGHAPREMRECPGWCRWVQASCTLHQAELTPQSVNWSTWAELALSGLSTPCCQQQAGAGEDKAGVFSGRAWDEADPRTLFLWGLQCGCLRAQVTCSSSCCGRGL